MARRIAGQAWKACLTLLLLGEYEKHEVLAGLLPYAIPFYLCFFCPVHVSFVCRSKEALDDLTTALGLSDPLSADPSHVFQVRIIPAYPPAN